ncbi:MAG: chromosomal replication initiator protein DnaA [Bacteroidaceae bacterium]|nr:chromosomal replication initiator protein DnaA [Bacteroidaceae bacterium]
MIQTELENKWNKCLSIIGDNIPESAYKMWFSNINPLKFEDNTLWIAIPSQFVYEYIEEHYVDLLYATIGRVFGPDTDLMYSVLTDKTHNLVVEQESENKRTSSSASSKEPALKSTNKAPQAEQIIAEDLNPMLRPNYNFANFIEGDSNKLPRAAAESISKNPERNVFNPLFLYGMSGVGKTHLLNAIGLRVKELYPEKRVLYVSAHLFKVQYMDAVRKNTLTDFINFYQTIDVLLIDDIQEFVGAERTQNTFFHIFNHLHQNGKQLVMTCDRVPASLQGIEDRLITRFKWGLVAEIERPNFELRRAILASKVRHDGLHVSDDVLDYIAENITDSVRELEGSLNSIIAHATVFNREPDIALAERIINQAIRRAPREVTIDMIIKSVCDNYHVTNEELSSTSRKRNIVLARQVAMYLSHKHVKNITYARIGEYIGKKDHTTVLHSCTQVIQQMGYDKKLSSSISTIEKEILSR